MCHVASICLAVFEGKQIVMCFCSSGDFINQISLRQWSIMYGYLFKFSLPSREKLIPSLPPPIKYQLDTKC